MSDQAVEERAPSAAAPAVVSDKIKVWDGPTRVFHWTLAGLVILLWISAEQRWMLVHYLAGLATLALVGFRVTWGFIGSTTSRFADFVAGPKRTLDYFRVLFQGGKATYAGHNPAGGWMVLAFFALIGAQAVLGLLANDERGFRGPLAGMISGSASDAATRVHAFLFNLILLAIWTHLVAIFFYLLVKRENLILPMLTGEKERHAAPAEAELMIADWKRALFAALAAVVVVALLAILPRI